MLMLSSRHSRMIKVFIGLLACGLMMNSQAATVNWLNAQGGDWHNPANWSTGAVPTAQDDVVISINSAAITHLTGNTEVHSLNLIGDFNLAGGHFSVTGPSQIQGILTVALGATLQAQGREANLSVNGAARLDGGNVMALSGAKIHLPGATRYQGPGLLRAQGAGSLLDLSTMTDIGIGSPGSSDIKEAVSRAVSVYHKPILALEGGTNKGVVEAFSRPVSVYHKPLVVPEDANTLGISEAVSRAVSVYHKPFAIPEDDITFGVKEAISRAVSVYHKPYFAPEDPETLGIRDAYSRQLTIQNGAQP